MGNVVDNYLNSITGKAVNRAASDSSRITSQDSWKDEFCHRLDEMVKSFLYFPVNIPQSYRDAQFARHLLWMIGDDRGNFVMMFTKGARPEDFDFIWKRLFPYITGDFPEDISYLDLRLIRLSVRMYKIVYDLIMFHQYDFSELIDQSAQVFRDMRVLKISKH